MYPFTVSSDFTGADPDLPRIEKIAGFHLAETGGVAEAVVNLRNGGATGDIFIQIVVLAGESRHFSADTRIQFGRGLYVEVTGTGVPQGSIQQG